VSSRAQISCPLSSPGSRLRDEWVLYRSAASVHLAELQLLHRIGTRGVKAAAPLRRLRVLHDQGLAGAASTGSGADLVLAGEAKTGSEADLLRGLGNHRLIASYMHSAGSNAYRIDLAAAVPRIRPRETRGEDNSWQRPLGRRRWQTLDYSRIYRKHASVTTKRSRVQGVAPFLMVGSPQSALSAIASLRNAPSAGIGEVDLSGFSAIGNHHRVSLLRSPTAPISRVGFAQFGMEVGRSRSEAEIGLPATPAGTLGAEQAGGVQRQDTASTALSRWTDILDQEAFGDWIVGLLADKAALPPNGYTGADPRLGPTFPGAFGRTW
jgi:hypothetical protein